jgi:hypothetical protein
MAAGAIDCYQLIKGMSERLTDQPRQAGSQQFAGNQNCKITNNSICLNSNI